MNKDLSLHFKSISYHVGNWTPKAFDLIPSLKTFLSLHSQYIYILLNQLKYMITLYKIF